MHFLLITVSTLLLIGCFLDTTEVTPSESGSTRKRLEIESIGLSPQPCVATFTGQYTVFDSFNDPILTVAIGDQFVLGGYDHYFHEYEAELYDITENGVFDFSIEAPDTNVIFPFEVNCNLDSLESYMGAFSDVDIYDDSSFDNKICTIEKGTATQASQYWVAYWSSNDANSEHIYKYQYIPFEQQCGSLDSGFVKVPVISSFEENSIDSPVPIKMYMAEKQ
ncbi:MAG: hypothetical protein OCC49_03585 [Fibrobacterales bacterium]